MNETRSSRSSPRASAASSSSRLSEPMDAHITEPAEHTGSQLSESSSGTKDNQAITKSTQEKDGDACGKVWEIYAKEAQQYDKTLVESWKKDMDNILVFSGLYSAVLTAFVIESYKNLQEDPTETSAMLLGHIASQLASLSDARNATLPLVSFEGPTKSALACNILWFMSLILALFCAFLATLVQQWARQFLQKMGMARSSIRRARLVQFLYSGLKDYRMHAVVDTIPCLLHLSLFTFFGGLVAFLNPINQILTGLVASALLVIIVAYSAFTLFPLFPNRLNSPFRTPLSSVLWALLQDIGLSSRHVATAFKQFWEVFKKTVVNGWVSPVTRWVMQSSGPTGDPEAPVPLENTDTSINSGEDHPSSNPIHSSTTDMNNLPNHWQNEVGNKKQRLSLTRAMLEFPRTNNIPVDDQARLIAWTLKSMNDDGELLPFVEGLLDLLWGPEGLRKDNCPLIKYILETTDSDCDIIGRTISLMSNMGNSSFDDTQRKSGSVACPRLLHALAFALLPENHQRQFTLPLKNPGSGSLRISWFSAADISAIVESMKNPNIEHASAGSALALCLLLICQDIEDIISEPDFRNIHPQKIREYLVSPTFQYLLDFTVRLNPSLTVSSDNGAIAYRSGEPFKDQTAENIELLRSSTYINYIDCVLKSPPYNHSSTISKLESKPIIGHYGLPCAYLLRKYVESYPDRNPTTSRNQSFLSATHLDDIFMSAFDGMCSQRDTLENLKYLMGATSLAVYIAWRARKFGWTSTAGIWRDSERWPILCDVMTPPGSIGHPEFDIRKRPCFGKRPRPADIYTAPLAITHDHWSEAYREILLCLALRSGLHQEVNFSEEEPTSPVDDGEKPIDPVHDGEKPIDPTIHDGEKPIGPPVHDRDGEKHIDPPIHDGEEPISPVDNREKPISPPIHDGENRIDPPIYDGEAPLSSVDCGYQLLFRIQECLQPHEAILSPPLLSLKYLADFIAISACRDDKTKNHDPQCRITVERLIQRFGFDDMPLAQKVELAAPIALSQLLTNLHPVKFPEEARATLEYFSWLGLGAKVITASGIKAGVVYSIAEALLVLCKHFEDEDKPSQELLDILVILWSVFKDIARGLEGLLLELRSDPGLESPPPADLIWSALHPLIGAADIILSPHFQDNVSRLWWSSQKPEQPYNELFFHLAHRHFLITRAEGARRSLLELKPHITPPPVPKGDELATLAELQHDCL